MVSICFSILMPENDFEIRCHSLLTRNCVAGLIRTHLQHEQSWSEVGEKNPLMSILLQQRDRQAGERKTTGVNKAND